MPLTKRQIAIMCAYRHKAGKQPRDRMVLNGKVKLTPRRREILFHVACTEDIWWRVEKDWSNRWKGGKRFVPYLGATQIDSILTYLRRARLIRYSSAGPLVKMTSGRWHDLPPILLITPRGMDALLEITAPNYSTEG